MPVFQGFREFCQPWFCELKNQKLLDLPSLDQWLSEFFMFLITIILISFFVLFKLLFQKSSEFLNFWETTESKDMLVNWETIENEGFTGFIAVTKSG